MREHLKIISYSRDNPNLRINSNSEFYGACRHTPKLHRYAKATPLPVLMTNNSSKRADLPPNIPSFSNIPTNILTYVEQEQPANKFNPLAYNGILENGRDRGVTYVDV